MRKQTEFLDLQCALTDTELLIYAKAMAEANHKMIDAEKQKTEYNKQIGADISRYEALCHSIAHKIDTGKEFREVECRVVYDWTAKTKQWIRIDTGEIAKEDIIPEYELQEEIAFNDAKAVETPDAPEAIPAEFTEQKPNRKAKAKK